MRYERLTWPEGRRAAAEDRVALVPVATLEDRGRHLPGDTDLRIVAEICERASPKAAAVIERVRDSTRGGMAHARELRPRSTWRSTRTRSTRTWRWTCAAIPRASAPGWTGRTGR